MLWVLSEALLKGTHNMVLWKNKKNIFFSVGKSALSGACCKMKVRFMLLLLVCCKFEVRFMPPALESGRVVSSPIFDTQGPWLSSYLLTA